MIVRINRKDGSEFYGCKGYPECNHTVQLTAIQIQQRENQKERQNLVTEKQFLPATIVKNPNKRFKSEANNASYRCWVFFNKLKVDDVEWICDTVLTFYELKGAVVQKLKNLDGAYLYASKNWEEFSRFAQKYVHENNYIKKNI